MVYDDVMDLWIYDEANKIVGRSGSGSGRKKSD
jgi:hypothetical protein